MSRRTSCSVIVVLLLALALPAAAQPADSIWATGTSYFGSSLWSSNPCSISGRGLTYGSPMSGHYSLSMSVVATQGSGSLNVCGLLAEGSTCAAFRGHSGSGTMWLGGRTYELSEFGWKQSLDLVSSHHAVAQARYRVASLTGGADEVGSLSGWIDFQGASGCFDSWGWTAASVILSGVTLTTEPEQL